MSRVKGPDDWFRLDYNMNLYRGCQHQCIYCDSRSDCYQIEDFNGEILVKSNALELLPRELASKRRKGVIGFGSMNDPYMPLEMDKGLVRGALELIALHGFGVHIITKSALVLRDIDLLQEISRVYASVSLSISTADDRIAKRLEPGASYVSERLAAMKTLREAGITAGVTMMPVLPFIGDTEENIKAIVELSREHKASYILPAIAVTLRGRQKAYYYQKLDLLFPGLKENYIRQFRNGDYHCTSPNAERLYELFSKLVDQYRIPTKMPKYHQEQEQQLAMF